jgi:hypothetical protein
LFKKEKEEIFSLENDISSILNKERVAIFSFFKTNNKEQRI